MDGGAGEVECSLDVDTKKWYKGRRQEAGGRRQEAVGSKQWAVGKEGGCNRGSIYDISTTKISYYAPDLTAFYIFNTCRSSLLASMSLTLTFTFTFTFCPVVPNPP